VCIRLFFNLLLLEWFEINKPDQNGSDLWSKFALYGFLNLNLGLTIAGGYFLGRFLEQKWHVKNMTLIGVLVGLFLGLFEMLSIAFKAGSKK
jgi:hypothetical protein